VQCAQGFEVSAILGRAGAHTLPFRNHFVISLAQDSNRGVRKRSRKRFFPWAKWLGGMLQGGKNLTCLSVPFLSNVHPRMAGQNIEAASRGAAPGFGMGPFAVPVPGALGVEAWRVVSIGLGANPAGPAAAGWKAKVCSGLC